MDMQEIKNKSTKELIEILAEKRFELREFRFKVSERQMKNMRSIREVKKDIARILTAMRQTEPAGIGQQ